MSIFVLKIIACIFMVLDHIKYAIPGTANFFTIYAGRIAFPLFAFMLVEGYTHTKDLKKYYKRLIIFALISQIPFMLFRTLVDSSNLMLSIMFTMLIGLVAITIYDKLPNKFLSILLCCLIICLGDFFNVDYGWYGVALIFLLYVFRKNKVAQFLACATLIGIYYYLNGYFNIYNLGTNIGVIYFSFTIMPLVFIWFYNGKLGRKMKYFFYWFYPAHMLVLYIANLLLT